MEKLPHQSPDLTEKNIEQLAKLFPGVVKETRDEQGNVKMAIDLDLLRQEISDQFIEGEQERFQLDWPGKRQALVTANTPTTKTLRPIREKSVKFDTTKNLFIEGDNLEALKLLQEAYLGKIKLVYIDPPYNTGHDFVYDDDYSKSEVEHQKETGQIDEVGNRLKANTESNGRFHSDWLSMIYPRLRLARNLLTDDGLVCISIDDNEIEHLTPLCNEVFGESNHLNTFVWVNNLKGRQITGAGAVQTKEYIVCFARDSSKVSAFRASESYLREAMPSAYKGNSYEVLKDDHGPYVLKNELHNTNSAFNEETRRNLVFDIYFNPENEEIRTEPVSQDNVHPDFVKIAPKQNNDGVHSYHAFRWSRDKILKEGHNLAFVEKSSGWKVYTKVRDVNSTAFKDLITDISTNEGSKNVKDLGLDPNLFDYPKPVRLINLLVRAMTDSDSIVMDFFGGSGTTAEAVLQSNIEDGGNRRFVLVQLRDADPDAPKVIGGKFESIADLARERIKLAGAKLAEQASGASAVFDGGFRALVVDDSGFTELRQTPDATDQTILEAAASTVKPDRSSYDLLFESLLAWGLDLSMEVSTNEIGDTELVIVEDGALIACFSQNLDPDLIRKVANYQPLRAVFLDGAFTTDADRINAEQIFKEISPASEVKVI